MSSSALLKLRPTWRRICPLCPYGTHIQEREICPLSPSPPVAGKFGNGQASVKPPFCLICTEQLGIECARFLQRVEVHSALAARRSLTAQFQQCPIDRATEVEISLSQPEPHRRCAVGPFTNALFVPNGQSCDLSFQRRVLVRRRDQSETGTRGRMPVRSNNQQTASSLHASLNSAWVMRMDESQPLVHCSGVGFMAPASLPVLVPLLPVSVPPPEPLCAIAAPVARTIASANALNVLMDCPFTRFMHRRVCSGTRQLGT